MVRSAILLFYPLILSGYLLVQAFPSGDARKLMITGAAMLFWIVVAIWRNKQ
jgi:hypothetical protein